MASDIHDKKVQGMIANLPEKTGKSLDQWISIAAKAPVSNDAGRAAWFKKVHGLGHFQPRLVVAEVTKLQERKLRRS